MVPFASTASAGRNVDVQASRTGFARHAHGARDHLRRSGACLNTRAFAPTGTLRVGVLMVTYFALRSGDRALRGVVPEPRPRARAPARRAARLHRFDNPIARDRRVHQRASSTRPSSASRPTAPPRSTSVRSCSTARPPTWCRPARRSKHRRDRPSGVRLLVPARSAWEAQLKKTLTKAMIENVAVENRSRRSKARGRRGRHSQPRGPHAGVGAAHDAGSASCRATAQCADRHRFAKDRPAAVKDFAAQFAADVTKSGFVQQSLDRAGDSVKNVVVHAPWCDCHEDLDRRVRPCPSRWRAAARRRPPSSGC